MRFVLILACCLILSSTGLAPNACAADDGDLTGLMKPGLWETTYRSDMPGTESMPPRKSKECVTAEKIANFKKNIVGQMQNSESHATIKAFSVDGNRLHFEAAGDDEGTHVDTVMDYVFTSPTTYKGHMTMTMTGAHAMKLSTEMSGRRLGDCSGASGDQ